jgi:phage terminase large subunit GpA-like protein
MKRRSQTQPPNATAKMRQVLAASIRPRPVQTVSQWADRYRILTSKGSSEVGQWRTDRTPYLRQIMDDLSVTSPVQRIVLAFGSQIGKTEAGLNWLGYIMDHAPAPTLVVLPTLEVRKRWVRQRLDPLLHETPQIRKLFDARRKRDAGNSEDMKDFPGGILVIGGANSPASLASMPIRYVLCDEVDRFPWEVGQEGDPLGLIDERTKTFPKRKVLLVSTPTTKGASRIEQEYLASDQREFYVPCPHCGEMQVLRWRHPDGSFGLHRSAATGQTYYTCRECGAEIDEHHKPEMLSGGRWIAKHPERKVRGYHLSGLYSPLGLGFTWSELMAQWDLAKSDTAALKRFINTTLGEAWEEKGDDISNLSLLARLETYPNKIPATIYTAGVDVQKDRLEVTIVGWGANEEAWVIDHLILAGDTTSAEPWDELEELMIDAEINLCGIDAGYNTQIVYDFCERRKWAVPLKGVSGMGRPLIEDEKRRKQRLRTRRKKGTYAEPVGVDQGKIILYSRLQILERGPGYIHFPRDPAFDEEYFAQLAGERLITKTQGHRSYQEWVRTRARVEALDCLNYSLAAYRLYATTHKSHGSAATTSKINLSGWAR